MAFRGDEGRNKLRKATGIGKYEVIRGCPNGETYIDEVYIPLISGANSGN